MLLCVTEAGRYFMDLKFLPGGLGKATDKTPADVTITLSRDDFIKLFAGQMSPVLAFMSERLKIDGSIDLAMKLRQLIKSSRQSKL